MNSFSLLVGNVSRLNGSPVHDVEREDAERAFIRYYMDTPTKPARLVHIECDIMADCITIIGTH